MDNDDDMMAHKFMEEEDGAADEEEHMTVLGCIILQIHAVDEASPARRVEVWAKEIEA
jgi:hypothetical protein